MKKGNPKKYEKIKALTAKYKELSESEVKGLASFGAKRLDGYEYSAFNQCLIAFQEGRAGLYAGFNQWKAVGRIVKKGEHGFTICRPINGKPEPDANDDEETTRFAWITIFHESQTEPIEDKKEEGDM